ncbi:MAG: aminotransferase class V-fold PLP-dependent enzyme [Myxococcota bacterium]
MIYLDANADSPPQEAALAAYLSAAREQLPLSSAREREAEYLQRIATAIGARRGGCLATRGGTLADAIALELGIGSGGHVVTSGIEHAAVVQSLELLEAKGRCRVTRVPVDRSGRVDPAAVERAIQEDTVLVTVIAASNETGVLQPISELAQLARRHGARFHTDAVQLAGRMPVDVDAWEVDLASFSSHKFGAVGGTGFIYVRDADLLHEARAVPAQTTDELDLPGLASTSTALEMGTTMSPTLRDVFEESLSALDDIEVIGADSPRLPNTSLVRFGGCEADGLMMALDVEGIATSTGSACASGSIEPSPILLAMGLSSGEASQAIRFSLGLHTTESDVRTAAAAVKRVVELMRTL